jgi:dihydropteroate synthase
LRPFVLNMTSHVPTRCWAFRDRDFQLGAFPLLMGIVNVTPDSFSDGGTYFDAQAAVAHALRLADEGADLLDIGGESTRPGAEPVPLDEELRRVVPVIDQLARLTRVPLSIDTTKAEVARQALDAGAAIVNDISGLSFDAGMAAVCSEAEAGVICMHMQGTPATMQQAPSYADVVIEIKEYLVQRLAWLAEQGIAAERVVVDPGIGFGKTAEHNIEILSHIGSFRDLGRPVLIGHSRKRFLKALLGRTVETEGGGLGVSIALAMQGVDLLRVHDVRQTRNALAAWRAIASRVSQD